MRSLMAALLRRAVPVGRSEGSDVRNQAGRNYARRDQARRDPAPTRWSYRYQRLMLTPIFRASVRIGLPALLLVFIAGAWFSNPANRAALAAQIETARNAIESRPEFMVTSLSISGADVAVAGAIKDIVETEFDSLGVAFPVSSFHLDLPSLRDRVTDLTAVADAVVRVKPGGTLDIVVTERRPVAVWRHVDGVRLIDDEGEMIGMIAARSDRPDLPLIAGDGAKDHIQEALVLFAAAAPVRDRIRGLVRMGERRWDLVLDGGQRILLPSNNPVAALDRVMAFHAAQDMLSRDVAVVDMRNGNRPTLRLNPMAVGVLQGASARISQ